MDITIDSAPGLAAIFVFLAIFFTLYAIFAPVKEKKQTTDEKVQAEVFGAQEEYVPEDAVGRYVRPILGNFLPQLPINNLVQGKRKDKINELLIKSGNPWKITAEEYVGIQLAFGVIALIVGAGLGFTGLVPYIPPLALTFGMGALGFLIPHSIHTTRKEKRAQDIQRQLPEALDLLTVTLTSGQTFVPALESVTAQMPESLLRQEFTRINVELQAGSSLDRSLTAFYHEIDTEEAESFSKAVIQTQRLGSDLSETLKQQSEYARNNYEARIEKMIARLSTTMFIPLIATMLPAFLVIFIAPTLTQLTGSLG